MSTSPFAQLIRDARPPEAIAPVAFLGTWTNLRRPGNRRLAIAWLAICAVAVPSGSLTRLLEWTGVPITFGGGEVYVTLYLPLVFCVPMVLWLGYWWAAIPAYLSTFMVALLGGMPIGWIVLFALANPIALAAVYLAYRAFPVRADLRSGSSFLYFVMVQFVSSMAGSSGSLVWALTNDVGLNEFYPVWQGWWLGGFLEGVLLIAPLLWIATPSVERLKARLGVDVLDFTTWSRRILLAGASLMLAIVVAYVVVVRRFMYSALDEVLAGAAAGETMRAELSNILAGLALPQWVLITLMAVTLVFGFRVGLQWSAQYKRLAEELEASNRELRRLAVTDSLTGCFNHNHLMVELPRAISAARRYGDPLSCVIADLDGFKQVNDRYGHLAGDEALRQLVAVVSGRLRKDDAIFRFGGDEFVLLMRHTDARGALRVIEDIRRIIAQAPFVWGQREIAITISAGVAELGDLGPEGDASELLALADRGLYLAKDEGRNGARIGRDA